MCSTIYPRQAAVRTGISSFSNVYKERKIQARDQGFRNVIILVSERAKFFVVNKYKYKYMNDNPGKWCILNENDMAEIDLQVYQSRKQFLYHSSQLIPVFTKRSNCQASYKIKKAWCYFLNLFWHTRCNLPPPPRQKQ